MYDAKGNIEYNSYTIMEMIKIKAYIKLYIGGRIVPFYNGYRPLFKFIDNMKTSGSIELIDSEKFWPGENGIVYIYFLSRKYLGEDFGINSFFTFGEGSKALGEGYVCEILSEND